MGCQFWFCLRTIHLVEAITLLPGCFVIGIGTAWILKD